MTRSRKQSVDAGALTTPADDNAEAQDKSKPHYLIKQYRQLRNGNGVTTRKETIGAVWRDVDNDMLTIRFNGVQVISNDLFAFPSPVEFNP